MAPDTLLSSQPKPKGWWERNWKWAVPVALIGAFTAFLGVCLAFVALLFGIMKSSYPYTESLATAQTHPAVIEALGEPIEPGFWLLGNIEINPDSGYADISFPIAGPDGSATVYTVAKKSAGRWTFTTIEAAIQGRTTRIPLLLDSNPPWPRRSP